MWLLLGTIWLASICYGLLFGMIFLFISPGTATPAGRFARGLLLAVVIDLSVALFGCVYCLACCLTHALPTTPLVAMFALLAALWAIHYWRYVASGSQESPGDGGG